MCLIFFPPILLSLAVNRIFGCEINCFYYLAALRLSRPIIDIIARRINTSELWTFKELLDILVHISSLNQCVAVNEIII